MPQEWVEESRDMNDMNKNWDGSLLDRRRSGVYPKMIIMVIKVPYIAIPGAIPGAIPSFLAWALHFDPNDWHHGTA